MSIQIGIAQARSLLLGEQVNESTDKRKANVFFYYVDKSACSNRISIAQARSLLSDF